MILNIFPSRFTGTSIAIVTLGGSLLGSFANFMLGILGDAFDTDANPRVSGYLLSTILMISFIGSGIFYLISGKLYKNRMKRQADSDLS